LIESLEHRLRAAEKELAVKEARTNRIVTEAQDLELVLRAQLKDTE